MITRLTLVATAALVLALGGCGGDDDDSDSSDSASTSFPALTDREENGYPVAEVATEAEAQKTCDAAQEDWPYDDTDGVAFVATEENYTLTCITISP